MAIKYNTSCTLHVPHFSGNAFYRHESAQGRDLAVLLAAVYKRKTGRLHVLDVMAGSGVRGARYLNQVCRELSIRLHNESQQFR